MTEEKFNIELKKIGIELNEFQRDKFIKYANYLLEYNKQTNLTAIRNKDDVFLKHFYDSLLLLRFKKLSIEKVLDIGSGPGFPGVPLKIVNPSIDLTVLDSNGKKTKFLEKLKDVLGIEYTVVNDRAENFCKEKREDYDLVVSRAVTSMPILAELSIPFLRVGGYFISYKGHIDENLENGKYAIDELGGNFEKIETYYLPFVNAERNFIVVYKKTQTKLLYPRQFDKINKRPLKKTEK